MLVDSETIQASIPRIVGYWRDGLRGAVDSTPRSGERARLEHALVAAVIDVAAGARADGETVRELSFAATAYGAARRPQRLDPGELARELATLRRAVWQCIRELPSGDRERLRFLARLDEAISIAVEATLRGGYLEELAPGVRSLGRWIERRA